MFRNMRLVAVCLVMTGTLFAQSLSPEVKAKVDARVKALQAWSTDPQIVAAVKGYNTAPPAEANGMTNEKWKGLTMLDPVVRSFTKNPLAIYMKSKRDDTISELFVSGADGGKVAFLAKTTSWTHKGKEKHEAPLAGHTWYGPVEVDESTGDKQVQVGLPVLDQGRPIGSIVVGFSIAKLN